MISLCLLAYYNRSQNYQTRMATYEPKNILITGAAGFIASHVTNCLVRNYPHYKIVVLDKLDYCSSLKNLNPSRASPNLKFVKGDIASADLVNHLLVTESIDTIMHFVAQTHVDNSFGNSFEFTKNNIYGTHVLLEACKVTGQIRRFIHVSTDEVYGETDEDAVVGNHEASQLLPTNPYSATKAGAEMLVMAYGRSYGLPVITTRGNNVYGPNQFPEKLIPKFILLAMRGLPLPIHGDGSNVRSYLYCEDVAEAFEVVLHKGEVGHVYNIGTVKERRVIDVAKDICRLFGLDTEKVIMFVENRPFNDQRYFLDDQKLKRLGWAERTPWEEGLKKTIEWYTTNPDYWGDVTGALLPHPRMLMIPGVERHNWTEDIKSLTSSPAEASTTAPATSAKRTTAAPQKPLYKFLIYGRTGWIGGLLGKICDKQGIPYEYGKGRLEERSQLLEDIRNVKPTQVFNAAGVTGRPNVDWCETHKQDTIRTNVVGILNLADVCREQGLLMINYATGCIFEYDAKHPEGSGIGFKEEDTPNFTGSFYSKTKAMVSSGCSFFVKHFSFTSLCLKLISVLFIMVQVEELLKEYDNVCTLRVRMPISSDLNNPRNFITKIARYDKVVNIPNSMTILDELLPISIEMAKRDCRGIWNFTNPGVVSHNEILEMYKKYINPDFKWTNFTLEEQSKVIVAPRSNNEMDASKLKAEFSQLMSIKDSLIKYVCEVINFLRHTHTSHYTSISCLTWFVGVPFT
jgi:UDP-glucose 4,6-dehydratase